MSTSPAPAPSPRRQSYPIPGASSPRPSKSTVPRLASISAAQQFDFDSPPVSARPNVVLGFSPPSTTSYLPGGNRLATLSPQVTTPVEQTFQYAFPPGSPRPAIASPRPQYGEVPRSRRNSGAIVSISLSSRSRSRTPRGSTSKLPGRASGQATPSKTHTPVHDDDIGTNGRPLMVQMVNPVATGLDEFEDWQPDGGMLLGSDDSAIDEDLEDDEDAYDKDWPNEETDVVEDVLTTGMLFGEGLEFRGEIIKPAVGKGNGSSDEGLPLRRGGSEVQRGARHPREKRVYEVVRKLGSGSYAVVYLVREKGGRRREFALKCLSKQDLQDEQIETQLFEATIHLSLPIHQNIVTLHQTLQTKKWLFLMLELCPGEDLFYWLERARDASPPPTNARLPEEHSQPMSSSKLSSSSIPFSSSQLFSNFSNFGSSYANSPGRAFSPATSHTAYGQSPASLLFAHNNGSYGAAAATPPTPSLLSAFSANTLLSTRRLRLIASMFSQMCEAVAICHQAGVSHRDIKPENFICCDSVELETTESAENERAEEEEDGERMDFGPQAKRKVIVKLTDFGLATTDTESGDVECGSKPYMSYECRNNLGPTYEPAPADVWSLGIVLINMLFHRNPWKDPTEGDPNFDSFLLDPTGFLLSKFTGIGREVATYLATRVLCTDVERRVSAKDFGKWIKSLPEMIAGRRAVHALKMAKLDERKTLGSKSGNDGLFVKSPIDSIQDRERKASASALTNTAPGNSGLPQSPAMPTIASGLSSLGPPKQLTLAMASAPAPSAITVPAAQVAEDDRAQPTPDLDMEVDVQSAAEFDDQPTPQDISELPSPDTPDGQSVIGTEDGDGMSTHKRRKRGVRKGKAAQAALAAEKAGANPSREERDALLAELAAASQVLARDLSKVSKNPLDVNREEDFPPLGTSPAQLAAKKSKWKEMIKVSSGGTADLMALRQRVAEREGSSGGMWSAPAKLQGDMVKRSAFTADRSTFSISSEISSAVSSFGPVSSATSSSGGVDDDDWRRKPREKERAHKSSLSTDVNDPESAARARKAALAAQAFAGGMDGMGAFGGFGQRPHGVPAQAGRHGQSNLAHLVAAPPGSGTHSAVPISAPRHPIRAFSNPPPGLPPISDDEYHHGHTPANASKGLSHIPGSVETITSALPSLMTDKGSDMSSTTTMGTSASFMQGKSVASVPPQVAPVPPAASESPNKPKIQGQIRSLAKMLSGLKTKGKGLEGLEEAKGR